jgi:hypothetical protein
MQSPTVSTDGGRSILLKDNTDGTGRFDSSMNQGSNKKRRRHDKHRPEASRFTNEHRDRNQGTTRRNGYSLSPSRDKRSRDYRRRDYDSGYKSDLRGRCRKRDCSRSIDLRHDFYYDSRVKDVAREMSGRTRIRYFPHRYEAMVRKQTIEGSGSGSWKKAVQVDRMGRQFDTMVEILHTDLWAFAKEMDPSKDYDHQTHEARDRLENRLYSEFDAYGKAERFNDKYIKSEVGKALIQYWYRIGKLVDACDPQPGDLKDEFWENMLKLRSTEASKKMSLLMSNKAKDRRVGNSTRMHIRQSVTVRLVSGKYSYYSLDNPSYCYL